MIPRIPKTVLKKFLARELIDLRWYKSLTLPEIEQSMRRLPVRPPLWTPLRLHQKIGFVVAAKFKRVALFYETGTGKTAMSIALARYFEQAGVVKHILVLVPGRVNKDEWAREIVKRSRYASYCVLRGSSKDKWAQLRATNALLIIETFGGLVRMACTSELVDKESKKHKLVPNKEAVRELAEKFQGLIPDESHNVKTPTALAFRVCRALSKTCKVVLPLTGTPFGRDPIDLWAQMYLVDHGATLGQTLGLFRAAFFKSKVDARGDVKDVLDPKKRALLHRVLAHRSLYYEADAADLPRVVDVPVLVTLPVEAREYYKRARETIIAAGQNVRDLKNAFLRMRQISSGFVGYYDDEFGTKATFKFAENPKLDSMLYKIDSIPDKIVICHEFIWSGRRIAEELTERGIGFVAISGATKDTSTALTRFDADPECQVLLLSNRMAVGLNLQVAKYLFFYESPVSVIVRKQARSRVARQESAHKKVFIYDFMVQGTVDELILSYQQAGLDLLSAIMTGKNIIKPLAFDA